MRTPKPSLTVVSGHEIRRMEHDAALTMTRGLRGIPAICRNTLTGVRRRRANRLAGKLPETCIALIDAGAPLSDVLAFPRMIESLCIQRAIKANRISLEQAQRDETEANRRFDQAQLTLAAHPNDPRVREEAEDAAYGQRIATDVELAVLATMTRTPEPPRAA